MILAGRDGRGIMYISTNRDDGNTYRKDVNPKQQVYVPKPEFLLRELSLTFKVEEPHPLYVGNSPSKL